MSYLSREDADKLRELAREWALAEREWRPAVDLGLAFVRLVDSLVSEPTGRQLDRSIARPASDEGIDYSLLLPEDD